MDADALAFFAALMRPRTIRSKVTNCLRCRAPGDGHSNLLCASCYGLVPDDSVCIVCGHDVPGEVPTWGEPHAVGFCSRACLETAKTECGFTPPTKTYDNSFDKPELVRAQLATARAEKAAKAAFKVCPCGCQPEVALEAMPAHVAALRAYTDALDLWVRLLVEDKAREGQAPQ